VHDSSWIGIYLRPCLEAVAAIRWDTCWARGRVSFPGVEGRSWVADCSILPIGFGPVYQVTALVKSATKPADPMSPLYNEEPQQLLRSTHRTRQRCPSVLALLTQLGDVGSSSKPILWTSSSWAPHTNWRSPDQEMAPRHIAQDTALVTSSYAGCPSPPRSKSPMNCWTLMIATVSAWTIEKLEARIRLTPG
jgi:hypothetical protein